MILLIDNYDSFVFNLARYVAELGAEPVVVRNDQLTVAEIERLQPEAIIISPGPCTPAEAGVSLEVIRQLGPRIPLLGVCLGHQAIAQSLGGLVVRAPVPIHGQTSWIRHHATGVFRNLANPFRATRYHSLIVSEELLPAELKVVARTDEGLPMALEHRDWPCYGVQFHPESVLTDGGHQLLRNFLDLAGVSTGSDPGACEVVSKPLETDPDDWHCQPLSDIPTRPL